MNTEKSEIKKLCEHYGISQTELSKRFGIPYRTVQDWYSGSRQPAPYIVNMLKELLEKGYTS